MQSMKENNDPSTNYKENGEILEVAASMSSLKRLAYYVTFLGWFILFVYIFAFTGYFESKESIDKFVAYFISFDSDGIKFRALIFFTPFITSVLGYFLFQISKLYEKTVSTEEKLKNALSEWRATFDHMPNGVMLVDQKHNILRVNGWMSRMFGYPIKTLITMKCQELIRQNDEEAPMPLDAVIETNKPAVFEHKDETLNKIFQIGILPLELDRSVVYLYSIVDISELKEKEKRLAESKTALAASYKDLQEVLDGLIFAFADALDAKSPWTRGHSERVKNYAVAIGSELGFSSEELEILRVAALLHDIGKIGTYDLIIDKPGKLTAEEYSLVKLHPDTGARLLSHIGHLESVIPPIRHHHERMDGKGYPDGLLGESIPRLARILCVADSYDAMTADRPYRAASDKEFAVEQLKRNSGTQFDPEIVEAFLRAV